MVFLVGNSYGMEAVLVKPASSTSSVPAQSLRLWVVIANAILLYSNEGVAVATIAAYICRNTVPPLGLGIAAKVASNYRKMVRNLV